MTKSITRAVVAAIVTLLAIAGMNMVAHHRVGLADWLVFVRKLGLCPGMRLGAAYRCSQRGVEAGTIRT